MNVDRMRRYNGTKRRRTRGPDDWQILKEELDRAIELLSLRSRVPVRLLHPPKDH